MTIWDTVAIPAPGTVAKYRAAGWWRDSTALDDLAAAVRDRGDHPALVSYQDTPPARTLSYTDLADTVERFASALGELGVQRGDVVVTYLPNLWMLPPLYLACLRVGAVSAPVQPGGQELAQVLAATGARVCVTTEEFGAVLAEVAPETLAHRVVLGDAAASGAIDFGEFFVDTPWEQRRPVAESERLGPDEPAHLLFTAGTTGAPQAVVHTQNTIHASVRAVSESYGLTGDDVIAIPDSIAHMTGMSHAIHMPLLLGATLVIQDRTSAVDLLLDRIAAHHVTWLYCTPGLLVDLLAAQRKEPRDTAGLQQIVSGSAPVRPQLVTQVRHAFGVPLQALWGMTENGAVTLTGPDDPEGWAEHSDGRSMPWMEIRIDAETGQLHVRGASQCLGYIGQPEAYAVCVDADGWFDTGDLARPDGRGGIRITGRRADRITRAGGAKVSTVELESLLRRHPGITEVTVVGYQDPARPGGDLVCAVVVPEGVPVTVKEVHTHLAAEGMAQEHWPDRIQFVSKLPRNPLGEVLRQPLRKRLEIAGARR